MSVSTENFIKNIYLLENAPDSKASGSMLAESLGISLAAVTDMLRKLKREGIVEYIKYSIPLLTPHGNRMALQIIRRHRIWETFLYRALNIPWERVHDEAENLEHQTSEYLLEHLERFMGFPDFDPHGDPIPDKQGNLPHLEGQILYRDVSKPGTYRITRISDHSDALVAFMQQSRLMPGDIITIPEWRGEAPNKIISNGVEITVEKSVHAEIHVKPINL